MAIFESYPHGVPGWVTALARDVPEALAFYAAVFGWTYDHSEEEGYAVAYAGGRMVAGIGPAAAAGDDVPPAWMTEVRVDDVDAIAERVPGLGGAVLAGPMDLSPATKLVVLADPAGATICAYEPVRRQGAELVNSPGAWAMSALTGIGVEDAATFYGELFGWEREAFGPATLFRLPGYVGGEPEQPVPRDVVAAMVPGEGPAVWAVDFWVQDAEATARTAVEHGGAVIAEPFAQEPFRRAVLADPGGAVFSVSQLLLPH